MQNHVQTRTFGLMMLVGAELGRDRAIKKYGLVGKHRILPKQFGEYFGEKIIETEMICVSTNTMNYDGYLNCRNYSFILKLLGHPLFYPLNILLKKIGIEWYDFSRVLFNKLKNGSLEGKFRDLFLEFNKKAIDELFTTKEECMKFYQENENYNKMVEGNLAENLAAKYVVKGIINYNDLLDSIFITIEEMLNDKDIVVDLSVLESSQKWLKNLYLINEILSEEKLVKQTRNNYDIDLNFDFPNWLENNSTSIEKYQYKVKYNLNFEEQKITNIKKEINSIFGGDKISAFERFLERRHMIGFNFLEKKYNQIRLSN